MCEHCGDLSAKIDEHKETLIIKTSRTIGAYDLEMSICCGCDEIVEYSLELNELETSRLRGALAKELPPNPFQRFKSALEQACIRKREKLENRPFQIGDSVIAKGGPWSGVFGKISSINEDHIEIQQQGAKIRVNIADIDYDVIMMGAP